MNGLIYYDGPFGKIKAVSMTAQDLGLPALEVPYDDALGFLEGSRIVSEWTVGPDAEGNPRLYRLSEFDVHAEPEDRWSDISLEERPFPITIGLIVGQKGFGEVVLRTPMPTQTVKAKAEHIQFVFTRPNDPDEIYGSCSVALNDLNQSRSLVVRLPRLPQDVQVWTRRLDPLAYSVEFVEVTRPIIPLPPGPLNMLKKACREDDGMPGMIVKKTDRMIEITLRDGGGPRYDRNITALSVALCEPGDPDVLLFRKTVSVEDLMGEKTIQIKIPKLRDFELYTDILYCNVYFVDAK